MPTNKRPRQGVLEVGVIHIHAGGLWGPPLRAPVRLHELEIHSKYSASSFRANELNYLGTYLLSYLSTHLLTYLAGGRQGPVTLFHLDYTHLRIAMLDLDAEYQILTAFSSPRSFSYMSTGL